MATPNTAILLSQLTQEADTIVGTEFMLIEVAGVHRKIQFANLGLAGAVWSDGGAGSFGTRIFYDKGNVGIGTVSPSVLLDINADTFGLPTALKARSGLGIKNCFTISGASTNSDFIVGCAFEVGGALRWRKWFIDATNQDDDEFVIEKVGLGNVLKMKVGAVKGIYWMQNLPTSVGAETGQLWNDAGTIKVSP